MSSAPTPSSNGTARRPSSSLGSSRSCAPSSPSSPAWADGPPALPPVQRHRRHLVGHRHHAPGLLTGAHHVRPPAHPAAPRPDPDRGRRGLDPPRAAALFRPEAARAPADDRPSGRLGACRRRSTSSTRTWPDSPRVRSTLLVLGLVFVESGLLVGFFLPGDTVLFTAGLLAATRTHLSATPAGRRRRGGRLRRGRGRYLTGRRLGRPWLERRGERFGTRWERAEAFYRRWGWSAIVPPGSSRGCARSPRSSPGRPGCRTPPSPPANLVGAVVWGSGLVAAGLPRPRHPLAAQRGVRRRRGGHHRLGGGLGGGASPAARRRQAHRRA